MEVVALALDMHLPFLPFCFCFVMIIFSKGQSRKLHVFSFFLP